MLFLFASFQIILIPSELYLCKVNPWLDLQSAAHFCENHHGKRNGTVLVGWQLRVHHYFKVHDLRLHSVVLEELLHVLGVLHWYSDVFDVMQEEYLLVCTWSPSAAEVVIIKLLHQLLRDWRLKVAKLIRHKLLYSLCAYLLVNLDTGVFLAQYPLVYVAQQRLLEKHVAAYTHIAEVVVGKYGADDG